MLDVSSTMNMGEEQTGEQKGRNDHPQPVDGEAQGISDSSERQAGDETDVSGGVPLRPSVSRDGYSGTPSRTRRNKSIGSRLRAGVHNPSAGARPERPSLQDFDPYSVVLQNLMI